MLLIISSYIFSVTSLLLRQKVGVRSCMCFGAKGGRNNFRYCRWTSLFTRTRPKPSTLCASRRRTFGLTKVNVSVAIWLSAVGDVMMRRSPLKMTRQRNIPLEGIYLSLVMNCESVVDTRPIYRAKSNTSPRAAVSSTVTFATS